MSKVVVPALFEEEATAQLVEIETVQRASPAATGRSPAQQDLEGVPVTAARARRTLARSERRQVTDDQIADALDLLVDAGLADRQGDEEWMLRAKGSEAWIRLRLAGRER